MPRLLVSMGAYNEAQYLDETIPAMLSQSMADFALLLFDNGSTDATWEILQRYAAEDARITLTRSPVNLWPPVATNRGIARAFAQYPETRWHLSHGADDRAEPGYLEAVLRAADENPEVNCIFSPWQYIGGVPAPKRFPLFDPERCHDTHMVPAWRAITRELWDAVGPENESIRIGSDWEWPVRGRHLLNIRQLERPYLSLRVRPPGRVTQSEEVDWRSLYRHLCRLADKPIAGWAC